MTPSICHCANFIYDVSKLIANFYLAPLERLQTHRMNFGGTLHQRLHFKGGVVKQFHRKDNRTKFLQVGHAGWQWAVIYDSYAVYLMEVDVSVYFIPQVN